MIGSHPAESEHVPDTIHALNRLAAVAATALLDTPAEDAFDELTQLAAVLVSTPFAFVTIVDDRRSFWKSAYGLADGAPRENTVEESFCQYVVRSQRELIVEDATRDERTRANPSVTSMGVRAWAGFPLLAPDGQVLGSFCAVDTQPRAWSARDLETLRALAGAASREIALRAAVANERALRIRAEALTRTLQASLVPPALPAVAGLDVASRFHPAGSGSELGGDFYDIVSTRDGGWAFIVGDVCGKGIEAAKIASLALHTIAVATTQTSDPARVMAVLNETLLARREAPDLFLTAIFGVFRMTDRGCDLRLASAGHLPPIVRSADGRARPLEVRGPLIGVFPTLPIEEYTLHLDPGEALIVYTDGVSEARAGREIFGEDAVAQLIATATIAADAEALADRIEAAALAFSSGFASDDIAVLVLRVPQP